MSLLLISVMYADIQTASLFLVYQLKMKPAVEITVVQGGKPKVGAPTIHSVSLLIDVILTLSSDLIDF